VLLQDSLLQRYIVGFV